MTETEWLAYNNPWTLFRYKWEKRRSGRKLRLFAVACCRRGWSLLDDTRSRHAVDAHEAYADRLIDKKTLDEADADAAAVMSERGVTNEMWGEPANMAAMAVTMLHVRRRAEHAPSVMTQASRGFAKSSRTEMKIQADLFREIFGNPFHPKAIDHSWLTWNDGTIPSLALAIYDDKAFDRMPILGDALEEAGCADSEILDHCRHEGGHVRGCWVLDLVLGRR